MNDYEKLMQAAEFVRKYLEEHCGLNIEIRISRDRVDVLRCEFGIPFSRTIPDEEDEEPKQPFGAVVRGLTAPRLMMAGQGR